MAKNRYLAALLSLIIAGLGQLYAGRMGRALAFIVADFASSYLYLHYNFNAGFLINILVKIVSAVDAFTLAGKTKIAVKSDEPKQQEIKIKAY